MLYVAVLAGGLGKRMKSDLPKVLHQVGGMPMLARVIRQAFELNPVGIFVVVGKYQPIIDEHLKIYLNENIYSKLTYVNQAEAKGTGHAIQCCKPYLVDFSGKLLVLSGDVPLISAITLADLLRVESDATVMTTTLENPDGYGRVITNGGFRIVEHKDASDEELLVNKINCGIYTFDIGTLCQNIGKIDNNNAQGEYYLPDVLKYIGDIKTYELPVHLQHETVGVNTKEQLDELNRWITKV